VEPAAFGDLGVEVECETFQFVTVEPGARWHAPESYQWIQPTH
jgi:hypothetical protein